MLIKEFDALSISIPLLSDDANLLVIMRLNFRRSPIALDLLSLHVSS